MAQDKLENEKSVALKNLLDDWAKQISTKPKIVFPDDGKAYPPESYFCYDGFFPGYFSQRQKVLFVARETRWISGENFCDTSREFFKKHNINSDNFWRKVLYMLYGIRNEGKIPYAEIPYADDIAKQMVESTDFGFAVMQLSKYSNDSDNGSKRNIELMNRFLEDSELEKRNFFQEELALLNPDIMILANLWECGVKDDYLELCFPSKNFKNWKNYKNVANYGEYDLNGKNVRFINTYHFSSIKSIENCFYNPVMEILFPKK